MITAEKKQALEQIATLAQTYDLTLDEIGAFVTKTQLKSKSGGWLVNLMAYLGAALVFGGLGLYIAMEWDDMDNASRVIITLGPGLVAFILGMICTYDQRFTRAATPLFLKAAILQPVGMFTYLDLYVPGDDPQLGAMTVFGIMATQFLLCFAIKRQTTLLFFGYLFWNAALGIFMDRCDISGEMIGLTLGASIVAFAWHFDKTIHRGISPFYYFIGSIGFLWSVFDLVDNSPLDILFLPAAIMTMLLSTRIRSRTLLMVGTFSLLGFLGYYTEEYFKDIVGWPIALILMGFALIGISMIAIKLGRQIKLETA